MLITALVIVGVLIILVMIVVGIYNKLVTLKNRFENAFSQIEVQLQRRYDLIPNLIETVKGYMAHEKETLEAVIQARNQAQSSLQAASKNPVTLVLLLVWQEQKVYSAVHLVVFLHYLKATQILKPTKIWQICRRNLVLLRIKSHFQDKLSMTRLLNTIPINKHSPQLFLRVCLDTDKTVHY